MEGGEGEERRGEARRGGGGGLVVVIRLRQSCHQQRDLRAERERVPRQFAPSSLIKGMRGHAQHARTRVRAGRQAQRQRRRQQPAPPTHGSPSACVPLVSPSWNTHIDETARMHVAPAAALRLCLSTLVH